MTRMPKISNRVSFLYSVKSVLKDKTGTSFPLIVAVALALVMIFTGVSEYFRLMIVAQGVRDALQTAVVSTVVGNYADVYHGVREGYSGGYQPIADDFEESLDYGDIYNRLDSLLGLRMENGYHVKFVNNTSMDFRLWGLEVDIRNAPLASGEVSSQRFEADCSVMLEVPVSFGGAIIPPMRINVKTTAGYTPRF